MRIKFSEYRADLFRLMDLSKKMYHDIIDVVYGKRVQSDVVQPGNFFFYSYQSWYTEALECIRRALPARLDEFQFLYMGDIYRKELTPETYAIRDWLLTVHITGDSISNLKKRVNADIVLKRFQMQYQILESACLRWEEVLTKIENSSVNRQQEAAMSAPARAAEDFFRIIAAHKDQLFKNGEIPSYLKEYVMNLEVEGILR